MRLATLLAADGKVDVVLIEADRLDRQGKSENAAILVEGEATRALDDARALLGRTDPETPWGRQTKSDLGHLLDDRGAAMAVYASALRSSNPQAKLGALTTQANLERRALALAKELKTGPK